MGKSSLLVRTRERLRQAGVACATADITQIGSDSTLIEWYAGIIRTILDDFHWDDFDLTEWWESRDLAPLSPLHHLSQFIEKVLLVQTEQPIVIFIDETDAMRQFGEDFFAMIRSCYNLRADKPAYQRLTFAILGVVSPSDLIQDKGKTPFNIGKGIELTGLETSGYPAEALLSLTLQWTGGQPFLTQKVCQLVREAEPPLFPLLEKAGMNNVSPLLAKEGLGVVELESWLTQLIQEKIIKNWEAQDEPAHLRNIRDRLLQKDEKNRARLLGLYQRILQRGEIPTDGSSEQMELRLSGAVVQREGVLRPYSEALQGWLDSGEQDESGLLRGDTLEEALNWLKGQKLDDQDYRFLSASERLAHRLYEQELLLKHANIIERQKRLALQAVNNLTYELIDQLLAIPRTKKLVMTIFERNVQVLEEIHQLDPDTREAQREKSVNFNKIGDVWLVLSNTSAAVQAYEQSLEIGKRLAASDPDSTQAQRDLSISYLVITKLQIFI